MIKKTEANARSRCPFCNDTPRSHLRRQVGAVVERLELQLLGIATGTMRQLSPSPIRGMREGFQFFGSSTRRPFEARSSPFSALLLTTWEPRCDRPQQRGTAQVPEHRPAGVLSLDIANSPATKQPSLKRTVKSWPGPSPAARRPRSR